MNWPFVKSTLAFRRQRKRLTAAGYVEADPTACGFTLFDRLRQRGHTITDVQVSTSRRLLFIKTGEASS